MDRSRATRFLVISAACFIAQVGVGLLIRRDQALGYQLLIAFLIAISIGAIAVLVPRRR